MGTEEPDVWPRTVEISFGRSEVSRHEFYNCFEPEGVAVSAFDAVARLPGRTLCIYRVGFKSDEDHLDFISKFGQKESVTINGKAIPIRVRDRTLNLVRVRIHHLKFNEDVGSLAMRLRQYGKVTRLAWDTYQDRQLPKWSGIKTGVVNVDMEIHSNIPSYITFGSYKHPLMVEYAGQTKTCRICESPCHVATVCPKLTIKVAPVDPSSNTINGPRSYSNVVRSSNKPSSSGWQTVQGNKAVPAVEANIVSAVAQMLEQGNQNTEPPGSTPTLENSFSKSMESLNDERPLLLAAAKPTKRKTSSSKEQRDNEKQLKRDSRRNSLELQAASQGSEDIIVSTLEILEALAMESGQTSCDESPTPQNLVADEVERVVTDEGSNTETPGSIPRRVEDSQHCSEMQCSDPIPAGQKPPRLPDTQGEANISQFVTPDTPPQGRKGNIRTATLAAMDAVAQKKLSQRVPKASTPKTTSSKK